MILSFAIIQVSPVSFNYLEVVTGGHFGINHDICGGVFLQVTIEVLDFGNMTLVGDGTGPK